MAFTGNSELFAAVHEDGVNLVARHVMRQRPSLFNYGTAWVAALPDRRLCRPIVAVPDVAKRNNPLITIVDPIPVPLTNDTYALDFCLQITDVQVDLHPGGLFELPPELRPLPEQRVALRGRACAALGCPPLQVLSSLPPAGDRPPAPVVIHPAEDAMTCFCLDFFAIAGASLERTAKLEVHTVLDRVELVDVGPPELESTLECFAVTTIALGLLPKLRIGVQALMEDLLSKLPGVALSAPGPAAVPHDPAIADDQLKLFLNLEVPA